MSDVMLFGVLQMPYEMAMTDELSRRQYWQRGQQAADEITRLRAELEQAQMQESCAADLAREWEQHCKRAEAEVEKLKTDEADFWQQNSDLGEALIENDKLKAALKEIGSITVHSGGDIHGISPTAWRAAFDHAHAVARAALGDTP